ncbi:carbamoyl-phosphate synthase domain-containing protein, partial [Salmonella enterica]
MFKSAILVLQDGTTFHGRAIGAEGAVTGEVVFNTSMTGYQEILTDPSYSR